MSKTYDGCPPSRCRNRLSMPSAAKAATVVEARNSPNEDSWSTEGPIVLCKPVKDAVATVWRTSKSTSTATSPCTNTAIPAIGCPRTSWRPDASSISASAMSGMSMAVTLSNGQFFLTGRESGRNEASWTASMSELIAIFATATSKIG